jgi:hypothetical protein
MIWNTAALSLLLVSAASATGAALSSKTAVDKIQIKEVGEFNDRTIAVSNSS